MVLPVRLAGLPFTRGLRHGLGRLARSLALQQDPAEMAVLRPELDAPGVIGPGLTALRAGGGQLLIPPDPAIAVGGEVSGHGHVRGPVPGRSR